MGIDVAKDRVDVAVLPGGRTWPVNYDEGEVAALVAQLETIKPESVILESTGGLETPLVAALAAAALPVVVVNPRQVRDFAKSTGQLAKTDRLDALILAHFGEAVRPPIRPLRDADTQALSALLSRRRQVSAMLTAEKNRLSRATPEVGRRIQDHIAWLQQEIHDLDTDLQQKIHQSPVWREQDNLLRSVPGVGPQVSLTLLADLPELGSLQSGPRPSPRPAQCLGEGLPLGPSCSWAPWLATSCTPCSGGSASACWPPVNRRNWHLLRQLTQAPQGTSRDP